MRTTPTLLSLAAAVVMIGCGTSSPTSVQKPSGGTTTDPNTGSNTGNTTEEEPVDTHIPTILDKRVLDYSAALRSASLKLVRALPTLEQIKAVGEAKDKKAAYEAEIDKIFEDVRFQERIIKFWKDTMRQGGGANGDQPSRDTAPNFAAKVFMEGRPYSELFTAANGTCPSYDGMNRVFVDGDCANNVPQHAGVLTNPGVQYQFYSNMAFRRVRWVQEIFVCTKFPAEYSDEPIKKGNGDYVSPWQFESVGMDPINFQDTSSVICANCHTTMNHIAPLFANFDMNGNWTDSIQVVTPVTPEAVPTKLEHWLKPGEQTSWRLGEPANDLPALGQAMAKDPAVAECAVARMWNFAMSKEDIVSDLATVPFEVIEPFIKEFNANGMNLKEVLRSIVTSDDFVRF